MARVITVFAALALALPTAACNCAASKRAAVAAAVNARVNAAAAARLRGSTGGISPVANFNTSAYTGLWYQVYDDVAVQSTFEGSKVCVTAQYAFYPNGSVAIINQANNGSVTGPIVTEDGYATEAEGTPSAWTVYLDNVAFGFQYWVIALGPATYGAAGLYQYAVVSDPLQLSLFVLARDVSSYLATYDAGVQAMLAAAGFNTAVNTPVLTQQTNCTYPAL